MNLAGIRGGAQLARWLASAAALWGLAATGWLCWSVFAVGPASAPVLLPEGAFAQRPALERYSAVVTRNLFRPGTGSRGLPERVRAAPSRAGLLLLGTVLAPDARSLAVVRDPADRRPRVVGIGALLRGGAEVVEIERGALLLSRGGQLERLALRESAPHGGGVQPVEEADSSEFSGRSVASRRAPRAPGSAAARFRRGGPIRPAEFPERDELDASDDAAPEAAAAEVPEEPVPLESEGESTPPPAAMRELAPGEIDDVFAPPPGSVP